MKRDSVRTQAIMTVLALVFLIAGVWALVSPDDGSRGPRFPLTSTEAGLICIVAGVLAAFAAFRTRAKR